MARREIPKEKWISIRSISGAGREVGLPIDVPSRLRCTRAIPSATLDHLELTPTGLFAAGESWRAPIETLAECSVGDRVFVGLGRDASEPPLWILFEVVS